MAFATPLAKLRPPNETESSQANETDNLNMRP
jgi:hypothetical protein